MIYYSVAHYYDIQDTKSNIKYDNIKQHIRAFLNIEEEKEFILVSFVDAPRGSAYYEKVKKHLEEFCLQYLPKKNYHVAIEFNWGGTIAALWYAYLYVKSQNISDTAYIAHFEEDFHSINNDWFIDSKNQLNSTDAIYIGECIGDGNYNINKKYLECDDWVNYKKRAKINSANDSYNHAVWTEGGFYFSKICFLKQIDNKIGIFHKGDQNTKYHHDLDGIDLGEVGFPTLLFHNDFKFTSLKRATYFKHIT